MPIANPFCNNLDITICEDSDEAVKKGFKYNQPEYQPIEVKEIVIVRNGTVQHNSTVDFILEDSNGQKYMFMITGRLLKNIPC